MERKRKKDSLLKRLTDTNDVRIEEELVRPRVEMWVDEDAAWIAAHRAKKRGIDLTHFGFGHH
jgi:hypothetical protein